jgi:hypothetical protein
MDSTRAKVANAEPTPRIPKAVPTAAAVLKFIRKTPLEISAIKLVLSSQKRNKFLNKSHFFVQKKDPRPSRG